MLILIPLRCHDTAIGPFYRFFIWIDYFDDKAIVLLMRNDIDPSVCSAVYLLIRFHGIIQKIAEQDTDLDRA